VIDDLAKTIAAAIQETITAAVSKELRRLSLLTADADRAAFIDAFARTKSGQPNPNQVSVRQRANELVLRLESDAGNR
jgi:hypothetical protein